jgi:serralysin
MVQKVRRFLLPGMLVIGQLIGMKTAHAAAGSLDPAFGTGGVATTNLSVGLVNSIGLQSTGEILVLAAATPSNEVLRYTTEGELDTAFGNNGAAITIGGSMSITGDDQIVVEGIVTDPNNSQTALEVERLNANGSIDTWQ